MKALQIANGYLDKPLYKNLFSSLSNLGVSSTIYVPVPKSTNNSVISDTNVIVSPCFTEIDRYLFFLKQYKVFKQIKNLDFDSYDLVHAHTLFSTGYTALQIKKRMSVPYIVAVRNTDVNVFFRKMPWLKNVGVRVMAEAEYVIFLSKPYAEYVIKQFVPEKLKNDILKKIRIIPNGIDSFYIDHKANARKEPHSILQIIQIGDIDSNKNVESTVLAVKKANQSKQTRLTVVGEIKNDKYRDLLTENKEIVRYIPKQGKEKIIELLNESDIMCVPSHSETFGLVYAEAMTQGVPVIYTKGQGFDGQYENGVIGYAVDANDVDGICEAFRQISEQYSCISNNCINNCNKYSWDSIGERYLELYSSVCKCD